MDDPTRRKRQNDPSMHATSHSRYPMQDTLQQQQQRRSASGAPTDQRYRPAPLNIPPPASRAMGTASYAGYYPDQTTSFPGQLQQGGISYSSDYGQDNRQTQAFGGYTTNMMYAVPQAGTQSSVYDPTQSFPARQSSALGMMGSDVSAAYFSTDATQTSQAPAALPSQAQAASTATTVYQQGQLQGYQADMPTAPSATQPQTQEQSITDPAYRAFMDEKWAEYQTALRGVFRGVRAGTLDTASESLLRISNWLLTQVADLGLHRDNASLQPERLKLWNDFNYAWLSLFQRQKDMMEADSASQRSLISKEGLEKMGKELVRLCDGIERHGLVDYQYGVWEEQIIAILGECLDLYESSPRSRAGHATSSSHQGR